MASILQRHLLGRQIKVLEPREPVCVGPKEPLHGVLDLMREAGIGSVLVREGKSLPVGIFTERDCVTKVAAAGLDVRSTPVESVMSHPLHVERSNVSLARVLHTVTTRGIRHVPIVFPTGNLRILSIKDIVDFLYRVLTKKLVQLDPRMLAEEGAVDAFFTAPVSTLEPARPVCVPEVRSVAEALRVMAEERVGSVVVKATRGPLKGIFTERDYLVKEIYKAPDLGAVKLAEVMTRLPQTVERTASVSTALNYMSERGFRHLPVVDETQELVGMLSVRSFIVHLTKDILSDLAG